MKQQNNKIGIFIVLLFIAQLGFAQTKALEFDSTQFNFGTIAQGEAANHTFVFINNSKVDVQIDEVKTTCSCTASDWPQGVIKPGEKGSIEVQFDTEDKLGEYAKGINVYYKVGNKTDLEEVNLLIFIKVDPAVVKKTVEEKPVEKSKPHNHDDHKGHDHPH